MFRIRPLLLLLLALIVVAFAAAPAAACPTCKDGMEHDPAAMMMARGYFWSILFMMSMPFLILFSLGGYFYWEIRKARSRNSKVADSLA